MKKEMNGGKGDNGSSVFIFNDINPLFIQYKKYV